MAKPYQLCTTALWVSSIVILLSVSCYGIEIPKALYSEKEATNYLNNANKVLNVWSTKVVEAEWDWSSNITTDTARRMFGMNSQFAKFLGKLNNHTSRFSWTTFKDPNVKRQFKLFAALGASGLSEEKMNKLDKLVWTMKNMYSNATIEDYRRMRAHRSFEDEITDILATSTDDKELKHVWVQWRDASGKQIRPFFPEYVRLFRENAKGLNLTSASDYWNNKYEINYFRETMEHLWQQVKPLYIQVFAYVRRRLWLRYGYRVLSRRGPIPVHVLGDMWAQSWESLAHFSLPFKEVGLFSPTQDMIDQEYTVEEMFKVAEEFYKSLNFSAFPESFWKKSIFERPSGRNVLCHPASWDFHNSKDYRVKMCGKVNFQDFTTAHKITGQMLYAMQYKDQPYIYRDGAFDGFPEAVGDAMALSVISSDYLYKIGLFPNASRSFEESMNHLYNIALDKVTFVPFSYIMDLWRWNVFDGTIPEDQYNCDWWDMRYNYQGFEPPLVRNEKDFDPGSKCHIIGNVPYIKFFLSTILQFQFHQGLCEKAGEFDPNNPKSKPLHECNIYENTKVGNVLKEMMKLGRSKPWFEAIEIVTGKRIIDATPLLNYFKPLHEWLEKTNDGTGELLGWRTDKTMCVKTPKSFLRRRGHFRSSPTL